MKSAEAKKNGEPKQKEANNRAPKPSRPIEAAPRAEKPPQRVPAEQPRPAATDGSLPMPDLAKYGVAEREARDHVGRCEPCGRAHKHVLKNPKDVMAVDSFGRRLATCLAVQGEKARA